jgi:hypothetical protein
MNKTNSIIKCDYCDNEIDLFSDEYFRDELLDDSGPTDYVECDKCGKDLFIKTHATYTFSIYEDK